MRVEYVLGTTIVIPAANHIYLIVGGNVTPMA